MQDTWETVKSGDFQFSLDVTEVNKVLDIQTNLHICHWDINDNFDRLCLNVKDGTECATNHI